MRKEVFEAQQAQLKELRAIDQVLKWFKAAAGQKVIVRFVGKRKK